MANGRSPDQKEHDLELTARMYLQGATQAAIAKHLGVTQQTVSNDLKEIRARWRESSIRDFDAIKEQELAKIDLVESQYWEQWEQSKKTKITTRNEDGMTEKGSILKEVTIAEEKCGDPRYLDGVMKCIERRCALLGLDSELKYQDLSIAIGRVIQAGYVVQNSAEPEK